MGHNVQLADGINQKGHSRQMRHCMQSGEHTFTALHGANLWAGASAILVQRRKWKSREIFVKHLMWVTCCACGVIQVFSHVVLPTS